VPVAEAVRDRLATRPSLWTRPGWSRGDAGQGDLRHSHAAWLIAGDVHPKVIQARLGHASIRTTLDTYGHLLEGLDEAAAEAVNEAVSRARVPVLRPFGEVKAIGE